MNVSLSEQETILIFNAEKRIWEAGTNIQSHQRMFEKQGWRLVGETPDGEKAYEAPKNAITFRDLSKKREVSEEQRAALAERMRNMQAAKAMKKAS